jgi:hypothetical protein
MKDLKTIIKEINEKYGDTLEKLSKNPTPHSPWNTMIENVRVASEALADAHHEFVDAIEEDSDSTLKNTNPKEQGKIIGRFLAAEDTLYALVESLKYQEYVSVFDSIDSKSDDTSVTLDLDEKTLSFLAIYAHNNDITINEAVNRIVRDALPEETKDGTHPEG